MLAAETGRPLVQHVVDAARRAMGVRDVIVATDHPSIATALRPFGTRCVMTAATHVSGTDRVAEVARDLPQEVDVIVNVQGDEPEIEPETIDALIRRIETGPEEMATAATRFPLEADVGDPNLVKVVAALDGKAIYFSRSAIPFHREADGKNEAYYLHQGIYAYRRRFLMKFTDWGPTPLELTERLEQLRVLEHGERIAVIRTDRAINGIDTPQQYAGFVSRYKTKVARE